MEVPTSEEILEGLKTEARELQKGLVAQILELDLSLFTTEDRVALAKHVLKALDRLEWGEAHEGLCRSCGCPTPCYCDWDPKDD